MGPVDIDIAVPVNPDEKSNLCFAIGTNGQRFEGVAAWSGSRVGKPNFEGLQGRCSLEEHQFECCDPAYIKPRTAEFPLSCYASRMVAEEKRDAQNKSAPRWRQGIYGRSRLVELSDCQRADDLVVIEEDAGRSCFRAEEFDCAW